MSSVHLSFYKTPASVDRVVQNLDMVAKSGNASGHHYIVIEGNAVRTTTNKGEASSFKELTHFVNKLLNDQNISIEDKLRIQSSFKAIAQHFERKPLPFLVRIFSSQAKNDKDHQVKTAQFVIASREFLRSATDLKDNFLKGLASKYPDVFYRIKPDANFSANVFSNITFKECFHIVKAMQRELNKQGMGGIDAELAQFEENLQVVFGKGVIDSEYLAKIDAQCPGYNIINHRNDYKACVANLEALVHYPLSPALKVTIEKDPQILKTLEQACDLCFQEREALKDLHQVELTPFSKYMNLVQLLNPLLELVDNLDLSARFDKDQIKQEINGLGEHLAHSFMLPNTQIFTDSFELVKYNPEELNRVPEDRGQARAVRIQQGRQAYVLGRREELNRVIASHPAESEQVKQAEEELEFLRRIEGFQPRERTPNLYERAEWRNVNKGPDGAFISGERVISFQRVDGHQVVKEDQARVLLDLHRLPIALNKEETDRALGLIGFGCTSSEFANWLDKQEGRCPSKLKAEILRANIDNLPPDQLEARARSREFVLSEKEQALAAFIASFYKESALAMQRAFWTVNNA